MTVRYVPHHLAEAYRALGWELRSFTCHHGVHAVLAVWAGPEPAPEPDLTEAHA